MEELMTTRIIKHEIKLQPSVIVILGLLALGVCGIAFAPAFEIRDANAVSPNSYGTIVKNTDYSLLQMDNGRVRKCFYPKTDRDFCMK